jgi:hypothetical protein
MQITLHSVTFMHHLLIWAGSAQPTVSMHHANKASVQYTQRKEKHLLIHLSWSQYTVNTNSSEVSISYWWQPDLNPSPSNASTTALPWHLIGGENNTTKFDNWKSYNFKSNSQAVHETILPEYSALITIKIGWKIHKLQSFWTLVTLWVTNFKNWVKKSLEKLKEEKLNPICPLKVMLLDPIERM